MSSFLETVKSKILVGDGAMGTMLMQKGLEPGTCPDVWNIDRRGDVVDVLRQYRQAGADTLISNTFGANRWKLSAFGLEGRVIEINRAGVEAAREAAEGAFVLGDIGPTGRLVAPLGDDPREAFVKVFAEQAHALAEGGADAIILETFISLEEALAALEAAQSTGLPVIASLSYTPGATGSIRTMMGEDIPRCVERLAAGGADVVGANCSTGPQHYVEITRQIREAADLPVMIQPNAGAPKLVAGKTVFPMTPEAMAEYVQPIVDAGANVVGGCCGTTPEHIRAIRKALGR